MTEWMVHLVGAERDLRFLATTLHKPDCQVIEDDGEFHLRSRRFDALAGAGDVKAAADEMVDQANLAALVRFEGYKGVFAGAVIGLRPDGSRHVAVSVAVGAVIAEAAMVAGRATVDGSALALPDMTEDMALLQQRPALAKALRYLREEPNWHGYYKAYEAVRDQFGDLPTKDWTTGKALTRFTQSAQPKRHHEHPGPKRPMSDAEGRSFILRLLQRWLDWERSGKSGAL